MGKIIQIKEEQIINGGNNIPIYPITSAKATYYKDGKHLQKKLEETESGEILNDSVIITRHIKDQNITTYKIKDEAVTFNKLDKATRDIIKSATGTPKDLVEDLDKLMKKVFPAEISCNFIPISLQEKGTTCTVTINNFKAVIDGKVAAITRKTVNNTIVEGTEYTEQINDSKSFTIVIDAEDRTSTINKSVTFVYPIFTGFNSATEFTESLVESLTKLGLRSSLGTITDTKTNSSTSNYYWIISPYKVNNVVTSGISIINDFIYTIVEYKGTTYYCYRLNAPSSADTFTFTIS